jgi:hypothetical protein
MQIRAYSLKIASVLSGAVLLAGSALVVGVTSVGAQAPGSPPAVRYYGTVTLNGAPAPSGATVTAQSAASPGTTCGTGNVGTNGSYFVDINAIGGCLGNVSFTVNGQKANQTGTAPANAGSAARLDLTVSAATPAATPPPPPTVRAAPPPPPPTVATAVIPAAPPNTGVGPGPARVTQAPAAQAPRAAAPAPVAPALPNTGTGGLLQSQTQNGVSPWSLAGLLAVAVMLLGSAGVLYRRTR